MVETIIFLVSWPVTEREAQRFGYNVLRSYGFEVLVYDLSLLLNSAALEKHPVENILEADFIRRIDSYKELDRKVQEVSSKAIFIDCLIGLTGVDYSTEKVFRVLKKHCARYCIISTGALPLIKPREGATGFMAHLFKKAGKATRPEKLFRFAANRIIRLLSKLTSVYPEPYRIFACESEMLEEFLTRYDVAKDRVVPIHSFDYDTYLEYTRSSGYRSGQTEKICVFLDEAATHHPDFELLKIKPLDGQKYFPSMRRLFDLLEKKTGLRVVVAAHPRSKYENMPGVFGGREIVKGKTVDLVAKSSMVIAHSSTSVSFAVLFDKPILLAKTSEMALSGTSELVETIAASLGLKTADISDTGTLDRLSFDPSNWKGTKYEEYKYRHLKSRSAPESMVWEIVAAHLKEIKA